MDILSGVGKTSHTMQFDFEHYLKAGHGRAYLMAEKEPERYREAILNACRKDYTFDMVAEGSRAFLTADLIDLFEDPAPFIDAAKESFNSSDVDDVKNEIKYLSDLLIEFGQWKTVLRKYFSLWKKIKNTPYSHLAERSSPLLANVEYLAIKLVRDRSWKIADNIVKDMGSWYLSLEEDAARRFAWFYYVLEDQFGEDETRTHLLKMAETSPEFKAFCDKDLRYEEELLEKFQTKKNSSASDATEKIKARNEPEETDGLQMLIENYKPSDEEALLAKLESIEIKEENEKYWHHIGCVILEHDETLPVSILMWVYDTTLCSFCRQSVVEKLIESDALPDSVRNECMWDANLELRELVTDHSSTLTILT